MSEKNVQHQRPSPLSFPGSYSSSQPSAYLLQGQFLGLNKDMTGATPDVFGTSSAMRANSGGLSVGGLLGTASFIVSCVVGFMCIIRPFKVDHIPFLRDVGFFTLAIAILLFILRDGKLYELESTLLVLWYVFYGLSVVVGDWWVNRREKKHHIEAIIRGEHTDEPESERYSDLDVHQVVSLLVAPAVMALTLTLPVVVTPYGADGSHEEKMYHVHDSRLSESEEAGIERALIAEHELQEELHETEYNKWFRDVQCILGLVLRQGTVRWKQESCVVVNRDRHRRIRDGDGFSNSGLYPAAQIVRCSMGSSFLVSVVWIMVIADEVVNILQTRGVIFVADAILSLTIFTIGNSLADLVTNTSTVIG